MNIFSGFFLTLHSMVDWLHVSVFTVGNYTPSRAELCAVLTGGWGDILLVRRNVLTWPVGIVNNLMQLIIYAMVGLLADASLQIVYLILATWGWLTWNKRNTITGERVMSSLTRNDGKRLTLIVLIGFPFIFGVEFAKTHAYVAIWDAFTTMVSVIGIWCQAKRKWQAWVIWCAVDCIYVPLYAFKHLYLQALLYVVFVTITIFGIVYWRRQYLTVS